MANCLWTRNWSREVWYRTLGAMQRIFIRSRSAFNTGRRAQSGWNLLNKMPFALLEDGAPQNGRMISDKAVLLLRQMIRCVSPQVPYVAGRDKGCGERDINIIALTLAISSVDTELH